MDCDRRPRPNQALIRTIHTDAFKQLTTISRSGTFTLSGNLPPTAASISVNGAPAQTNGDFTFSKTDLTLADGNNTFTVSAQNRLGVTTSSSLTLNLPAMVSYTYDQNGNLLTDGTRSFKWDAADQLVQVSVPNAWQTQFARDGLGRLRVLREFTWLNGAWSQTNETHYLYDGNLIVQERDANNNVMATYTRGLDLSGGLSGAGGIGGLLSRTAGANSYYYHADGAGNITAMLDGNENVVARYLYDPFGRVLGQWGALAAANPMQFSSMPRAPASGLSLYPFRAYDPALQRWLSRDPLGEAGGINLYGFVGNSALNAVDPFGEWEWLSPSSWLSGPDIVISAALPLPSNSYRFGSYIENNYGVPAGDLVQKVGEAVPEGFLQSAMFFNPFSKLTSVEATVERAAEGEGLFSRTWGACKKLFNPSNERRAAQAAERAAPTAEQLANLARFEKKLPANATPTEIFDLPNGGRAFQANSPSKNIPNSFAQYEKQVDAAGNTLQFTKTTFGPNGEIIHVKDKMGGGTFIPGQ